MPTKMPSRKPTGKWHSNGIQIAMLALNRPHRSLKRYVRALRAQASPTDRYSQISEAFEVLSDKNKRAVYDQFGEEGLKGAPQPPGASGPSNFPGGFASGFSGGTSFPLGSGFTPGDPNSIFE
jgi:hypothetical protein